MKKETFRTKGHQKNQSSLVTIACFTFLAFSLYLFGEWLFLVTKPSFLSALSWFERIRVLLGSLGVLFIPISSFFIFLLLISRLAPCPILHWISALIPTILISCYTLLLVDNFTYIVYGFGVSTIEENLRILYYLLLIITTILFYKSILDRLDWKSHVLYFWTTSPILIISFLALLSYSWNDPGLILGKGHSRTGEKTLPNIIMISSDGLNASHLSLYGYGKNTTPFLKSLSKTSLIADNCFTNGGPTAASITSRLTGKLPTQTRVIYPPDILRGTDSFQHLPGILKRLGYTGIDISIRHYADSTDLNFRQAFDVVNSRSVKRKQFHVSHLTPLEISYFLSRLQDRILSRLQKIFFNLPMSQAFEEVTEGDRSYKRDPKRMEQLFSFIDSHSEPFFAHVHLMGTHGPRFRTHHKMFSDGANQDMDWKIEFYDDSILDFDAYIRQLIDFLKKRNLYNRSVVVIGSDHGQRARTADRIPMLIRFPEGQHSGRITANVQNIDIAPTLLDYLRIPIPKWMMGRSLLSDQLDSNYPILAANRGGTSTTKTERGRELNLNAIKPPFYSLGQISVVICSEAYRLYLENGTIDHYTIPDHTDTCGDPPKASMIENLLLTHLRNQNYDTKSLNPPFPFFENVYGF